MTKTSYLFTILMFSGFFSLLAQRNILNAKSPQEIGQINPNQVLLDNDSPLAYGYVEDRDILWSRATWEFIDIDERVNFPLFFPVDTMRISSERRSLFDVLIKNIRNGNVANVYNDSYFLEPLTIKALESTIKHRDTTKPGFDQYNEFEDKSQAYVDPQFIRTVTVDAGKILGWRIRGLWYVDKRQGDMRYRIIGIAPVAYEAKDQRVSQTANANEAIQPISLFWIWYPDVREILHEAKAFNRKNSSQPISYDHLLNSRRFSAMIYKDDNVHGDRGVTDYIIDNALMQLLESERLKEQIRNIEIDLWNY